MTTKLAFNQINGNVVSVKDFGAVGDGVTDDVGGFELAIASLTRYSCLTIPAGHYILNSDNFSGNFLEILFDDVTIRGEGAGTTKITVTGTSAVGIFYANNKSRVTVEGIEFVGNNVSTSFSYEGTAVWFNYQDTGAAAGHGDCAVINCKGSEFKGPYWFIVHNQRTVTTYPVEKFRLENITCTGGSDRDATSLSVAARQVGVHCVDGGLTRNITFESIFCEASDVKMGIACQGTTTRSIEHVKVSNCVVLNAGGNNANTDVGRYGIMFYFFVDDVSVVNCTMKGCEDLGLYSVSNGSINISNCHFEDCNGSVDGTLIKGGLGIGSADTYQVTNCTFLNNGSFHAQFTPAGEDFVAATVHGNSFSCTDGTSNGVLKVRAGNTTAALPSVGINFSNNTVHNSRFRFFDESGGQNLNSTTITNNTFFADSNNQNTSFITGNSQDKIATTVIKGNTFHLVSAGAVTDGILGKGGPVFQDGLQITDNFFTGDPGDAWINIRQTEDVNIANNHFDSVSTGYCFGLELVKGNLHSNTFANIATTQIHKNISVTPGDDLGRDTPTWTGYFGAKVQALNSSKTSQAAEWVWDHTASAWKESIFSDGGTGGTGSAGSGNQYVELSINGVTYKLLHDGTV